MTTQPDDKSEDALPTQDSATQEHGKAEELAKPQGAQELDFQTQEEIEDAESEAEAVGKTPRDLYKKLKRQLKAVMEYIAQMRGLEKANRKWLERRLELLEEEVLEVRVELKSFKALSKQGKGK